MRKKCPRRRLCCQKSPTLTENECLPVILSLLIMVSVNSPFSHTNLIANAKVRDTNSHISSKVKTF